MQELIEIHIITYNEEIMLPFTIMHYRKMFGNPKFIIHDNGSTDDTLTLAKLAGAGIIPFITEGMNDTVQSNIKSEAAMTAKAKWVLCIDCDEECLINTEDLNDLENRGVNIVKFQGWDIFDAVNSPQEVLVPMGCKSPGYSKPVLLRSGVFKLIHFAAGAHSLDNIVPKDNVDIKWSIEEYNLLHYKHWSCKYNINRSAELGARQSEDNLQKGHSFHFSFSEDTHQKWFDDHYKVREIIKDKRIN